jgi:DNA-binding HxlR family transcriptional regulator
MVGEFHLHDASYPRFIMQVESTGDILAAGGSVGNCMLGRTYDNQNCSVARALEVVGERWSLLILRDAMFRGTTRFSDFQRVLGLAPNILANRLDTFVAADVMRVDNREYYLTAKGWDLQPALIALTEWGDRWAAPDGPPVIYRHAGCGGEVRLEPRCARCGTTPAPADVLAERGPGLGDQVTAARSNRG